MPHQIHKPVREANILQSIFNEIPIQSIIHLFNVNFDSHSTFQKNYNVSRKKNIRTTIMLSRFLFSNCFIRNVAQTNWTHLLHSSKMINLGINVISILF